MTADAIDPDNNSEGFSESWLTLREPADHAARNSELDKKLVHWRFQQQALQVVELGAGTGSNLRYLMPLLGHEQHWRLIDHDSKLLDHLPTLLQPWASHHGASISTANNTLLIEHSSFSASVTTEVIELADDLEPLSLDGVHLLTASALLDLTSASWLDKLVHMSVENRCACFFVLNYNGKIQWQPKQTADADVTALLNQHQLSNKGFGPALGPAAGMYIAKALENAGCLVETAQSNWVLNDDSRLLQQAIIDGWAPAAKEQDSNASALVEQWHAMRQQYIEQSVSRLTVGHIDVLSLP